ncbi:hypothetical protein BS50DRAFT_586931 [Corynespora cassiicola Philippines]|uniref:Uncharacterized protein n=1 Tax=Corynespora cassiicola Philippines TaxID=1448308 RepID=A0A2T2NQF3_CORCC|nr:hypothetical protein BS50DRAFT_586931 [Corynespora cassiicola Philippines]
MARVGWFGVRELDDMLAEQPPPQSHGQAGQQNHQQQHQDPNQRLPGNGPLAQNADLATNPQPQPLPSSHPPILELLSPPSSHHPSPTGTTPLIHRLLATLLLPSHHQTIPLSGHSTTCILILPPHRHSAHQQKHHTRLLARCMASHILSRLTTSAGAGAISPHAKTQVKNTVACALKHLHILSPTSFHALLSLLAQLPAYLLEDGGARHQSGARRVGAVVLEDMHAYLPSVLCPPLQPQPQPPQSYTHMLNTASSHLTRLLLAIRTTLNAPIVLSSRSASASPDPARLRAALPTAWPKGVSVKRAVVRRAEVRGFRAGVGVREVEGERESRGQVVGRGRFECFGVGEGRKGEGFVFGVGMGVNVEAEEAERTS